MHTDFHQSGTFFTVAPPITQLVRLGGSHSLGVGKKLAGGAHVVVRQ